MKVLIVDDEAPARERLKQLLSDLGGWELTGEAGDGAQALALAADNPPDVVLLDIRMPGLDGLETARHLGALEQPPAVIFVTAYDHYAVQAFDANAVGYLVKPVRRERLAAALANAARPNRAQLQQLGQALDSPARSQICARQRGALVRVPIDSVWYFRAEDKYVVVRHDQGELLIEEPLKDLEDEFGERFLRIHRSTLVDLDRVEALDKDKAGHPVVVLRDGGDRLDVSRRLLPEVRRRLKQG